MGISEEKKLQYLLEKKAEENKALKKILNSIRSVKKLEIPQLKDNK